MSTILCLNIAALGAGRSAEGAELLFARSGDLAQGEEVRYTLCLTEVEGFSLAAFEVEAGEGMELGDWSWGSWFHGEDGTVAGVVGDGGSKQVVLFLIGGREVSSSAIELCHLRANVVAEQASGISLNCVKVHDAHGVGVELDAVREVETLPPVGRSPSRPGRSSERQVPRNLWLGNPRPNPGIGESSISLELPRSTPVELQIFDVRGRLVKTLLSGTLPGGVHNVEWNGRDAGDGEAPPGIYFYSLRAGREHLMRKTALLR